MGQLTNSLSLRVDIWMAGHTTTKVLISRSLYSIMVPLSYIGAPQTTASEVFNGPNDRWDALFTVAVDFVVDW